MTTISVTETPVTVSVTDLITRIKLQMPNSKSAPVIFVASSDASDRVRRVADYICDGTADDVQIQAALDDIVTAGGGCVLLSRGAFNISTKLTVNVTGLWLRGESKQSTQLKASGVDLLEIGAAGEQLSTCHLSDFTILENGGVSTTAVGIEVLSAVTTGLIIERVKASGFGGGEFIINGVTNFTFQDNYISHNRASGTGSALKIIGQSAASWGVTTIKLLGNYFASTVSGADPMVYIEDVNTGRFIGNIYETVPSGVTGLHCEATSGNTAQDCVFIGEHFEDISGTAWTMKDVTNVVNICSRGGAPAFTWDAVTANQQNFVSIGGNQLSEIIGNRILAGLTGPNDILATAGIQVGPVHGGTAAQILLSKEDGSTGVAGRIYQYAEDTGGTPRHIGNMGFILSSADAALPSARFLVQAVTSAGGSLANVLEAGALGVQLGESGTYFKKVLHGVATWDPGSLNDGASATTTVTVTGATVSGSIVFCGMNNISTGGWQLTGIVTAANTVTVTLTNHTGGTVDLGAGAVRAAVMLV